MIRQIDAEHDGTSPLVMLREILVEADGSKTLVLQALDHQPFPMKGSEK